MLGRAGSLRRAATMSLRAFSPAEASFSERTSHSCSITSSWCEDTPSSSQGARLGFNPTTSPAAAPFSRPFSSLEQAEPSQRQATYYVEVITGDVRGAGTPAPAAITLYGEDGESESYVIGAEESSAGFERATRKTYVVYSKDLGQLKRVLVHQLAPSAPPDDEPYSDTDTAAVATPGWYLDRIEVRGPDGEHWTLPCGSWLGRSGVAADGTAEDGCEERNLIPADHHHDVTRSSITDPDRTLRSPLRIEASGIALPHPEKVQHGTKGVNRKGLGHGGEDSYFYSKNPTSSIFALGVADGVYEWRHTGIDAGQFSRELIEFCRRAVEDLGFTDVLRVLQYAYKHVKRAGTQGSTTACLLLIDIVQGRLAAANVGDSGFMVLGRTGGSLRGAGSGRGVLQMRYRSPQQEHSFGFPYQLGHHANADTAEDAMLSTMAVNPGDVIVMGSDGLFDNLSDEEIIEKVEAGLLQGQSSSAIAQHVAFEAFGASVDKRRTTPFSLGACSAFNMIYNGGKADDITVVVVEMH